jgi:spermidine/putrescine transport system permease protein
MSSRIILLITWAVYLFLFAPILVVIVLSFNSSQFGSFPFRDFTFHWYATLLDNQAILDAAKTSIILGVLVAFISTVIGVLAALALVRHEFLGKGFVVVLITAPLLIPETVLGVGLLLFMRALNQPRSLLLLLIGHVVLTLPFVVMVLQARLVAIKRSYEEAARTLGASQVEVLRTVTLPLLAPALFAAALFAFTVSFDNITASMFWRPGGVQTVPTEIFAMLRNSISPEINALGTVIIALTLLLPMIGGLILRGRAHIDLNQNKMGE